MHDLNLIEKDKIERRRALTPNESFIVQAPAGSGKTELLIQRFLTLLQYVQTPEEILAITFTKKAANEMRSRVINALKQAQEAAPSSAHALQTWQLAQAVLKRDQQFGWQIIQNPNQLRIQTIDAFCSYLTKQLPLLSHFGSQPNISDYPEALYREAVREVLSHVEQKLEWSQAISQLLLHVDNDLNQLHDLLIHLLSKRDQWLPYLHFNQHENQVKASLEMQLAGVIADSLIFLKNIFPSKEVNELLAITRYAADHIALSKPDAPLVACRDLMALPETKACALKAWQGLASLLLTKQFTWRKRADAEIGFKPLDQCQHPQEKALLAEYKERLSALIFRLQDNEALRLALSDLFFLPHPHYEPEQWDILKALLQTLKIVAAQLRVTFEQHGEIDFIENAQAAILALGHEEDATDLALALDYRITHILVDEFQDTSYTQYQLLEKLTKGWEAKDGRTLFVVGDPMQSIYRFREAEVGLFIRMRQTGIGHLPLSPLTLSLNFRSVSPIVEWNNQHFDRIFPPLNDMASGAVQYSPSVSPQISEEKKAVSVFGFVNSEDHSQDEAMIQFIQDTQLKYPQEKIALLLRSRSHVVALIPLLKKNKIPYQAIDIEPLAQRPVIQDLLSLTRALLKPYDRIAWLAILRAPWCGLSLADLLIIAGGHAHAAIESQLEHSDILNQLSEDGRHRLARVLAILKNKIKERDRQDLRSTIENTWLLLGGPACLKEETDLDDVKAYFDLLSEFDQRYSTLNLDLLKEKIAKLFAATDHPDANLHIMTIHAAKGLEFETVMLPHLQKTLRGDDKALLAWMERPLSQGDAALLLAPRHATGNIKDRLYEYICRQQHIKSDYETDRLLYVATTRAKKRLALFFNVTQNEKQEYKVPANSLLEKLWPVLNRDNMVLHHAKTQDNEQKLNENIRLISRLNQTWQHPIPENVKTVSALHQKHEGFTFHSSQAKWLGTVLHRILQEMAERSLNWWQKQNAIEQKFYIEHQLKQVGFAAATLADASRRLSQYIQQTLADPRGQWILHQHREAQSELALTGFIDNEVKRIIIDRTFIDEADNRWIIDYKTATLSHQALAVFLDKEMEKYAKKMQQYYQVMQLHEERPIRLGLYFPAIPTWQEIVPN